MVACSVSIHTTTATGCAAAYLEQAPRPLRRLRVLPRDAAGEGSDAGLRSPDPGSAVAGKHPGLGLLQPPLLVHGAQQLVSHPAVPARGREGG